MQPPPRKVKPSQEAKVRFGEQLASLQGKQQREQELLEDLRSYSKQRSAIEKEYGQALQRLASQFLKREWLRGRSESSDSRSVFAVWKGVIDGTVCSGQSRVAASENYRTVSTEAAKTARVSKEQLLKKGIEQLLSVQAELLETVKEVSKTKKQYVQLQRTNEVAREKAADVEARLRKSDHGIFHTKGSLQKLSAKFSVQLAENSQHLLAAQNEHALMLAAAQAHLEHYYQRELPAVIQTLDGDLYERLRDQLTVISKAELEVCQGTQEIFQGIANASAQVCREQNRLLFLQGNAAFSATAAEPFQTAGADQAIALLNVSGLEKEARRWATRAAKDYKIQTVSEQVLQRMETRRQQVSEAEASGMEKRMEEVKENIRKAEISKVKADARLALLRQAGLDVDTWLASAMGQVLDEMEQERRLSEARRSERGSTPTAEEFDLAEFEDYDDSTELFEDNRPSPGVTRAYPSTCRVFFPYQACQSDELTIVQGEELEVIEDGDVEEWVKARNRTGQIGYVPEKYLLFLDSVSGMCVVPDGGSQEGSSEREKELTDLMLEPGAWLVQALYDYEGQSPEELSFPEGAIIRVLPREEGAIDDGFWTGDFNGRVGVFPSLVVHEIIGAPGGAEQDLPSPSPPVGSPPVLDPTIASSADALLGGSWQGSTASGHRSPDPNAPRIRPVRAPPPPPLKAPEADPLPGHG
ncbi:F-BAR and double SH3 domains protein 1 [Eublepharis macularius]|uniref:F-BAR and double SH3 domains protein 1 n=1 Tax=Eublepharis macularius TaxID=481883 RepID=A0AA97JMN5_EUBMA|nr:F-BAR and double SH3 domains protein 1 [Eublepharis macularius]